MLHNIPMKIRAHGAQEREMDINLMKDRLTSRSSPRDEVGRQLACRFEQNYCRIGLVNDRLLRPVEGVSAERHIAGSEDGSPD